LHPHPGDRIADIGQDRGEPFERAINGRLIASLPQPVGQIIARQHHIGHAAHHPVEQFDRQADGALCGGVVSAATRNGAISCAIIGVIDQRAGRSVQTWA